MITKTFTFITAALFTLLVFWAIGFLWFSATVMAKGPEDAGARTDAIVVLTGAGNRVNTGVALLKDKKSEKLFISGVNKQVRPIEITGDNDLCCVTLGYEAVDTEGNARETGAWVKKNAIKSIRLVTSNYHMPRAQLELSREMPGVEIYTHPVESKGSELSTRKFWTLVLGEYNKTLLTWLRVSQPPNAPVKE